MSPTRLAMLASGVVLLLAGCAVGSDKAGSDTVTLRLATIDGEIDPTGRHYGQAAFVEALTRVSGGAIEVEMSYEFAGRGATAETELVRAIARGDVDGGWPSTRAFAEADMPGLKAIEAPFTLTNYDALREVITGPASDVLLSSLEGSEIVGLGTVIGELRRPISTEPLTTAAAWSGTRFRSYNSPVQSDTIRALGGVPVLAGIDWFERADAGELDGAEVGMGIAAITSPTGTLTTNVVLWPKIAVLSLNRARLDSLTQEQRSWIEQAATIAVDAATDGVYDESTFAQTACSAGLRFAQADEAAIDDLRVRVQPVLDSLAADPSESDLLAEVLKVADTHPAVEAPEIDDECLLGNAPSSDETSDAVAPIPDGFYRVDITLDDLAAADVSNSFGYTGTWTIEVEAGTYAYRCRPNELSGKDCGSFPYRTEAEYEIVLEAGFLRGDERTVRFVYDVSLHDQLADCGECNPLPTKTVGWRIEGDTLSFSDIGEPVVDELLIVENWTKVG